MGSILAGITIVFAIAWCVTALLYRASAALRHLVWTCAFSAALVLAPLRWQVPHHFVATAVPTLTSMAPVTSIAAAPSARGTGLDWPDDCAGCLDYRHDDPAVETPGQCDSVARGRARR